MKQEYEDLIKKLDEDSQRFWNEEYPKKSFEEKIAYWSGCIHRLERWAVESGYADEITIDKETYISCKEEEPNFDELLPHIIKKMGLNEDEIYRNIMQ